MNSLLKASVLSVKLSGLALVVVLRAVTVDASPNIISAKDEEKASTISEINIRELPSEPLVGGLPGGMDLGTQLCQGGAIGSQTGGSDNNGGFGRSGFPGSFYRSTLSLAGIGTGLETANLVLDRVTNMGNSAWNFVQRGKPIVVTKHEIATALPTGITCWTDLESWQRPTSKTFQISYKNGFGVEVVKFSYRLISITGGNVKGVGKYIGYATMLAQETKVAWGWDFNADITVPAVVNIGTHEAPLAGMQMELSYTVSNAMKYYQGSAAYFLDGTGKVELVH